MAAVLRGCDLARTLTDPALDADVDSAVRKLTFDLVLSPTLPDAERPPPRMDGQSPHAEALRALGEALLRRKRVTFSYRTIGRDDVIASRTVEPYGLFFQQGHWYLAAHDVEKSCVRNFRFSRMTDVAVNMAKHQTPDFRTPSSFRLTDHAATREPWEIGDGEGEEMILEFRGESGATRAAEKLGAAIAGQPRQRGFRVRRCEAFVRWAISFAGEVMPVAPSSLVDEYRATVARTLELYSGAAQ
jgi:predicted DNA-binding transcriptional regulator YafY